MDSVNVYGCDEFILLGRATALSTPGITLSPIAVNAPPTRMLLVVVEPFCFFRLIRSIRAPFQASTELSEL